jgi:hypothetical protein
LRVPRFRRRMALSTRFVAAFPYFRLPPLRRVPALRAPVRRLAGMLTPGRRRIAGYALCGAEQSSRGGGRNRASRVIPDAPLPCELRLV